MQTSKIKIGSEYAVKRGGEIFGIRVTSITTKRLSHITTNTVHGVVLSGGGESNYDPADLIGDFAEQTALVAKRKAENDARDADEAAKKARAVKVAKHLLKLAGMTEKDHGKIDERRRSGPVSVTYSHGVELNREAVEALHAAWFPEPATAEDRVALADQS